MYNQNKMIIPKTNRNINSSERQSIRIYHRSHKQIHMIWLCIWYVIIFSDHKFWSMAYLKLINVWKHQCITCLKISLNLLLKLPWKKMVITRPCLLKSSIRNLTIPISTLVSFIVYCIVWIPQPYWWFLSLDFG